MLRRVDPFRELRELRAWLASLPIFFWLLLALVLVARLASIRYGLPLQYDADEQIWINHAHAMAFDPRLSPGWYGAPASTLFYPLALLFALYGGLASAFAWIDGSIVPDLHREALAFYLIGRSFTVLTSLLVFFPLYAILQRLRVSPLWCLFAILITACDSSSIELSTITRMDMLQVLFMLLCIMFVIKGMQDVTLRSFIYAGFCVGLAATSKYPGIVVSFVIFAALVALSVTGRVSAMTAIRWLLLSAMASMIMAFLSAPYVFVHYDFTIQQIVYESRDQQIGAMKDSFLGALQYYFVLSIPEALGVSAAAIAYLSGLFMLSQRTVWIIPLFIVVYMIFLSSLSLQWVRWIVPVVPLLALSLAYAGHRLTVGRREQSDLLRGAAKAAVLCVALFVAGVSIREGAKATIELAGNLDTRAAALAWVENSLPKGSRVLIESFSTQISSEDYVVLVERDRAIGKWEDLSDQLRPPGYFGEIARIGGPERPPEQLIEAIEAADVDYIVLSKYLDFYRAEAHHWPRELAAMDLLLATYPEVMRFSNDSGGLGRGPTIRVLKRVAR